MNNYTVIKNNVKLLKNFLVFSLQLYSGKELKESHNLVYFKLNTEGYLVPVLSSKL